MAHVSRNNRRLNLPFTCKLSQRLSVFTPRRRGVGPGDLDRQFDAEVNFTTKGIPIHVRGLEPVFVQEKPARPNYRGSAVMLAPNRCVLEIRRVMYHVLANENISLPRTALEKSGSAEKRKPC